MKSENYQNQPAPNILIVDDDQFNLMILSEILKRKGYAIRPVLDGFAALQAVEELKPDLILLDVMMPGMDGYEVCQSLKEDPKLCDIPVIFISSLQSTKDVVKALRTGGADYITKPFQAEEVIARVSTHLKLHQQNKELQDLNFKLKESQDQLTKFAAHLLIVREEDRTFLSNELHDKIGQILIALKIDMGIYEKKITFLNKNDESREGLGEFSDLVKIVENTIKSVRMILSKLKSDDLELLGLIETAKLCCIEFEIINKINCNFQSSVSKLVINDQQKLALFRILEEALLNIAQHANASLVTVSMDVCKEYFIVEILDNGIGFDPTKKLQKEAYGLLDMKQRAEILQGKLTLNSTPGTGTSVKMEMPYLID